LLLLVVFIEAGVVVDLTGDVADKLPVCVEVACDFDVVAAVVALLLVVLGTAPAVAVTTAEPRLSFAAFGSLQQL
jgi:hypothetical protein